MVQKILEGLKNLDKTAKHENQKVSYPRPMNRTLGKTEAKKSDFTNQKYTYSGERILTGIEGLDKLIQGGLPKGSITLISGTPGTGKSILCSQIAYTNALNGKKCLYLNLEQNEGRLENQMEQFGWTPQKVSKSLNVVPVDSASPDDIGYLVGEITKVKYDIIILDSLDSISSNPATLGELGEKKVQKIEETTFPMMLDGVILGRLKLKKIFSAIAKSGATAILTTEKVEGAQGISRDTISEFLCDGIIVLTFSSIAGGASRTLEIRKMRLTKFSEGIMSMDITKNGILVTPLEEEKL